MREIVTEDMHQFLGFLEREIRKAQEAGELDPSIEPAQLAFEFDALGSAANQQFQLMHDRAIFERAATGMRSRLRAA